MGNLHSNNNRLTHNRHIPGCILRMRRLLRLRDLRLSPSSLAVITLVSHREFQGRMLNNTIQLFLGLLSRQSLERST